MEAARHGGVRGGRGSGRGSYAQDPEQADRAAAAVLDGPAREVPARAPRAAQGTGGPPAGVHWRSGGWQPSDPLVARPAAAEPAIGALFSPGEDADQDHHCSASVVHSPGGDLVATAAHCVYRGVLGFRTNLVFAPGYRDGTAPYGVWVPTRIDVAPAGSRTRTPTTTWPS